MVASSLNIIEHNLNKADKCVHLKKKNLKHLCVILNNTTNMGIYKSTFSLLETDNFTTLLFHCIVLICQGRYIIRPCQGLKYLEKIIFLFLILKIHYNVLFEGSKPHAAAINLSAVVTIFKLKYIPALNEF